MMSSADEFLQSDYNKIMNEELAKSIDLKRNIFEFIDSIENLLDDIQEYRTCDSNDKATFSDYVISKDIADGRYTDKLSSSLAVNNLSLDQIDLVNDNSKDSEKSTKKFDYLFEKSRGITAAANHKAGQINGNNYLSTAASKFSASSADIDIMLTPISYMNLKLFESK